MKVKFKAAEPTPLPLNCGMPCLPITIMSTDFLVENKNGCVL